MSYDPACYNLAVIFLSDSPEKDSEANRDELAQHIQTEIEGWIEYILKPASDAPPQPRKELAAKAGHDISNVRSIYTTIGKDGVPIIEIEAADLVDAAEA